MGRACRLSCCLSCRAGARPSSCFDGSILFPILHDLRLLYFGHVLQLAKQLSEPQMDRTGRKNALCIELSAHH